MPQMKLTPRQCADVMTFMSLSEPVEPSSWWKDPKGAPSHLVGHYLVLQTLEAALRG